MRSARIASAVVTTGLCLASALAFAADDGQHLLRIDHSEKQAALVPHTPSYKKLAAAVKAKAADANLALGASANQDRANGTFLPGEYYRTYRIDTTPFNDDNLRTNCGTESSALKSRYLAGMVTVEWQSRAGIAPTSLQQPITLFAIGDAKSSLVTNGCLIVSAWTQTGPFTLYVGALDDYIFHFTGITGNQVNPDTIAQIAKLGLAVAPLIPGAGAIPAAVATLVTTAAPDLDKLFSHNNAYSYMYKRLFTKGKYFTVSSSLLEGSDVGSVDIYEWRSASLAIDALPDGKLNSRAILANSGLGAGHRCWAGTASCQKEGTFEEIAQLKIDPYADYATVGTTDKPGVAVASWAAIASACDKIKTTANNLGLTPIDALLVRWAILDKYGILQALDDASLSTARMKLTLFGKQPVGTDFIRQSCWSTSDSNAFEAIKRIMF